LGAPNLLAAMTLGVVCFDLLRGMIQYAHPNDEQSYQIIPSYGMAFRSWNGTFARA
jgi:hypothetical protein